MVRAMGHQNSGKSYGESQKVIKDTTRQGHWLELAEYASLAGSAVGALAVAISGQAFYAVVPMTLALSLNAANRSRYERSLQVARGSEVTEVRQSMEKLEKNAVKAIVKLRQQLLKEIESIRETKAGLSDVPLAELERSAASVEESLLSAGDKPLTVAESEELKNRLLGLEEAIAALQQELEEVGDRPEVNLSEIETKVSYLEQQNKEVVKPHLKRLISLVKQLQKTGSTDEPENQSISVPQPKKQQKTQVVKQGDRGI